MLSRVKSSKNTHVPACLNLVSLQDSPSVRVFAKQILFPDSICELFDVVLSHLARHPVYLIIMHYLLPLSHGNFLIPPLSEIDHICIAADVINIHELMDSDLIRGFVAFSFHRSSRSKFISLNRL